MRNHQEELAPQIEIICIEVMCDRLSMYTNVVYNNELFILSFLAIKLPGYFPAKYTYTIQDAVHDIVAIVADIAQCSWAWSTESAFRRVSPTNKVS